MTPSGQWCTAIEDTDVVETEKAALKNIHSVCVFAIDPPREIQQQLLKHPLEEDCVAHATSLFFNLVNAPRSPCMNRWIHVAECPLVCRQLTVRMHVPFAQHQDELFLRELRIDERGGHAVERQIPRRIPWVFPLVRH